jgi:hypothetical protein
MSRDAVKPRRPHCSDPPRLAPHSKEWEPELSRGATLSRKVAPDTAQPSFVDRSVKFPASPWATTDGS